MRTNFNYFCFCPDALAEKQLEEDLFENLKNKIPIFNQTIKKISRGKYHLGFSTNFRKSKRIDVCVEMEGLRDIKVSLSTPFSFGFSFSERKIKKIFLSSLKETLKYY